MTSSTSHSVASECDASCIYALCMTLCECEGANGGRLDGNRNAVQVPDIEDVVLDGADVVDVPDQFRVCACRLNDKRMVLYGTQVPPHRQGWCYYQ